MTCNLCPRNCFAERTAYSGNGFCKAGTLPKIARVAPHYWEEPCISGTNGSGTIFFSHCTLRCIYCQNYEISSENQGKTVTVQKLSDCYKELYSKGVHNINLVTATPYVHSVIESMQLYRPPIPFVFNSSGYENISTIKMLDGYIDVFLPDFKYSDDALALSYSSANNYKNTALCAIEQMVKQVGAPQYDDNGIIQKGVIVRHLILPGHTKNSIEALKLLKESFGDDILVSLMGQYVPYAKAKEHEKLGRKITKREYQKVLNTLLELDLDGFSQQLCSADKKFIPDWDYET